MKDVLETAKYLHDTYLGKDLLDDKVFEDITKEDKDYECKKENH